LIHAAFEPGIDADAESAAKESRLSVLALVRFYLPGYKSGGPVRTITNMTELLRGDCDFRIVTSDRDSLDDGPYVGVKIDSWNRIGNAHVHYLSQRRQSLRSIARLVSDTPHDVLYLNSFFHPVFTQLPLLHADWASCQNDPS